MLWPGSRLDAPPVVHRLSGAVPPWPPPLPNQIHPSHFPHAMMAGRLALQLQSPWCGVRWLQLHGG